LALGKGQASVLRKIEFSETLSTKTAAAIQLASLDGQPKRVPSCHGPKFKAPKQIGSLDHAEIEAVVESKHRFENHFGEWQVSATTKNVLKNIPSLQHCMCFFPPMLERAWPYAKARYNDTQANK